MTVAHYRAEYKVNMGNYEHTLFYLDVMANNVDDYPDLSDEELVEKVKDLVREGLRDDIVAAHEDTDSNESFIHLHPYNQ